MTSHYTIGTSIISDALKNRLEPFLTSITSQGVHASLHETEAGDTTFFSLSFSNVAHEDHVQPEEALRREIAETIADAIISDLEPILLRRTLQMWKVDGPEAELRELIASARRRLSRYDLVREPKKQTIVQRLLCHVGEEDVLIIEGFVHFRLRDYVNRLQRCLEKTIERVNRERKQEELAHFLRRFMEFQEPAVERLHILPHEHHSFHLVDEQGNVVHDDYLESFLWDMASDGPVNREELLISALVTLAPQAIVCHLHPPLSDMDILGTVFHERLTYCEGCARCQGCDKI